MFVSNASCDHIEETYSSMGVVMALYVANIFAYHFPQDGLHISENPFFTSAEL